MFLTFFRSAWIAKSKPSSDGFGNPSGAKNATSFLEVT